jgi:hypothetical protein
VVIHGTPAAADAVRMNDPSVRGTTERRVDHEVDPTAADQLDDVVRTLADLGDPLDRDPGALSTPGRAAGREQPESEIGQPLRGKTIARLSRLATLTKTDPRSAAHDPRRPSPWPAPCRCRHRSP